jgi:hypothetical protein
MVCVILGSRRPSGKSQRITVNVKTVVVSFGTALFALLSRVHATVSEKRRLLLSVVRA